MKPQYIIIGLIITLMLSASPSVLKNLNKASQNQIDADRASVVMAVIDYQSRFTTIPLKTAGNINTTDIYKYVSKYTARQKSQIHELDLGQLVGALHVSTASRYFIVGDNVESIFNKGIAKRKDFKLNFSTMNFKLASSKVSTSNLKVNGVNLPMISIVHNLPDSTLLIAGGNILVRMSAGVLKNIPLVDVKQIVSITDTNVLVVMADDTKKLLSLDLLF